MAFRPRYNRAALPDDVINATAPSKSIDNSLSQEELDHLNKRDMPSLFQPRARVCPLPSSEVHNGKLSLKRNTKRKKTGNNNSSDDRKYLYPNKYPYVSLYRLVPKSEDEIALIANELLEWAQKESSIRYNDFSATRLMTTDFLYDLAKRSTYLSDAINVAKNMIGARREKAGLSNDMNASIVLSTAPMYDKSWKKMVEWKNSLRNANKEESGTKFIVVKGFEEVPDEHKQDRDKTVQTQTKPEEYDF